MRYFTRRWGRARAPAILSLVLLAVVVSCQEPPTGRGSQKTLGGVRELWRTPLPYGASYQHPAADGERLYADVNYQVIHAFDLETGEVVWRYPRPTGGPTNLVARDGRVFFSGSLAIALDAATGRELWRVTPDTNASFSMSAVDERAFYFGTEENRLHAVRVEDGAELWRVNLGPDWRYRGIVRGVSVSGDTVYAGVERDLSPNGHVAAGVVFALDRRDGRVLWSYQIGDENGLDNIKGAPTVAGRHLLVSDHLGNMYIALDRFSGQEVWRYEGDPYYAGPGHAPFVVGDTAIGASNDRLVTAFDLESGTVLWQSSTRSGSFAVAPCGDRILVNDDALNVLDRATGKLLAIGYEYDEGVDFPTTAFVARGNRAYVLGTKAAYAFECPS